MAERISCHRKATGDQLQLTTVDFGDRATIELDVLSGTSATSTTATGQNAVVTINGKAIANAQIDGNRATYATHGTHPVTISDARTQKFALSPDISRQTTFAMPGIQPELLGGASGNLADLLSGGSLSGLDFNTSAALQVVDEALAKLTLLEGRVDAFGDVSVDSASKLLDGLKGNVQDAIDSLD